MNFDLQTLWFILVGVLFTGYAILDGFDLGVGILLPADNIDYRAWQWESAFVYATLPGDMVRPAVAAIRKPLALMSPASHTRSPTRCRPNME